MTVPILMQTSAEPAKAKPLGKDQTDVSQTEGDLGQDFSDVMDAPSEGEDWVSADTRVERTDQPRQKGEHLHTSDGDQPDPDLLKVDEPTVPAADADTKAGEVSVAVEEPRRKVTIPDLPQPDKRSVATDQSVPKQADLVSVQNEPLVPPAESEQRPRLPKPFPEEMGRVDVPHDRNAEPKVPSGVTNATLVSNHVGSSAVVSTPATSPSVVVVPTGQDPDIQMDAQDVPKSRVNDTARGAETSVIAQQIGQVRPSARRDAQKILSETQAARRASVELTSRRAQLSERQTPEQPVMSPPHVATSPPTAHVVTPIPLAQLVAMKDQTQSSLHAEGDLDSLSFELRASTGSTTSPTAPAPSAFARADIPRHIAMQISDFVRAMPDKSMDVSLNPEELGRVRLSVSTGEGGVTLNILAERPETLDLMRRHAEQLARELSHLGFANIDLAFGQGRNPEQGDTEPDNQRADAVPEISLTGNDSDEKVSEHAAAHIGPRASSNGLDIRI